MMDATTVTFPKDASFVIKRVFHWGADRAYHMYPETVRDLDGVMDIAQHAYHTNFSKCFVTESPSLLEWFCTQAYCNGYAYATIFLDTNPGEYDKLVARSEEGKTRWFRAFVDTWYAVYGDRAVRDGLKHGLKHGV